MLKFRNEHLVPRAARCRNEVCPESGRHDQVDMSAPCISPQTDQIVDEDVTPPGDAAGASLRFARITDSTTVTKGVGCPKLGYSNKEVCEGTPKKRTGCKF